MIVDCAVYEQGRRRDGELTLEQASRASEVDGAFVWLGVAEPAPEEFAAVPREFDLTGRAPRIDGPVVSLRPPEGSSRRTARWWGTSPSTSTTSSVGTLP